LEGKRHGGRRMLGVCAFSSDGPDNKLRSLQEPSFEQFVILSLSKDQFCSSEKTTELILRQAQDDGEFKTNR
jgi:hypothetical protein